MLLALTVLNTAANRSGELQGRRNRGDMKRLFKLLDKIFNREQTGDECSKVGTGNDQETSKNDGWLNDGYSWIPDWKEIIGEDFPEWEQIRERAKGGPKLLMATTVGGNSSLTPMETLFAVALTLRGAEVHFLLCDKTLPACQNAYGTDLETQKKFLESGPAICDWCYGCGDKAMQSLGLPVHTIGGLLSVEDRAELDALAENVSVEEMEKYDFEGIAIGESVLSGALRFFGRGDFEGEPYAEAVMRRFFRSGLYSVRALANLYKQENYTHTVVNQGFYVPQGIEVEAAKKYGSRLVCWDISYRQNSITMCHDNTYFRTLQDTSFDAWQAKEWTAELEEEIMEYLVSRWTGQYDWMKFLESGAEDKPEDIARELGLDPSKPVIGLLTNVVWDAAVYYPGNAFPNMLDWLLKTISFFEKRPDLQLLIRVHPAEIKSWQKSRQFAVDEIKKAFPQLPTNIFIIPPESTINTYKAMMGCDSVFIYATTAGLELSCLGIPVVIAGEAWMRGKGVGIDVRSQEQYEDVLDGLPFGSLLSEEDRSAARKFAYHFFMRRMIPIGMLEAQPYDNAPYRIPSLGLSGFSAGADLGLDIVCDGILTGSDFVYPMEEKELLKEEPLYNK